MRKPLLFKISVLCLALGGGLYALGVALDPVIRSEVVPNVAKGIGALVAIAGLVLFVARQEKQNQRSNQRVDKLSQSGLITNRAASDEFSQRFSQGITSLKQQMTRIERGAEQRMSLLNAVMSETKQQTKQLNVVANNGVVSKAAVVAPSQQAIAQSQGVAQTVGANLVANAPQNTSAQETVQIPAGAGEFIYQTAEMLVDSHLPRFDSLPLSATATTFECELSETVRADIDVVLVRADDAHDARAALCYLKVFDENDHEIKYQLSSSHSDKYGYFMYLNADGYKTLNKVSIDLPRHARKLQVNFIKWSGYSEIENQLRLVLQRQNPEWARKRPPTKVKVAAILDEFSYNSFRYECDLLPLDVNNWREEMDRMQPDLFLCESAWSGRDSRKRPWQGRVYASTNFNGENRRELLEILEYCKQRSIPTVFWNKEDPSHYDDKVHNFVDTALKFDHIFTTDLRSVDRYKQEHGHRSVQVLPFAVQPKLFNPIEIGPRTRNVVFAGGWYSNHTKRSADMVAMFDAVQSSDRDLTIYNRFHNSKDPSHKFPAKYFSAIKPSVPNEKMAAVYKESEIGMTINTETRSATMFARRVFELMACNTYVVSNYSRGIEEFFGNNVTFLDLDPEALTKLSDENVRKARAENLSLVLSEHTYRKRFRTILDTAEITYRSTEDECALAVYVNNAVEIETAWNNLRKIKEWRGTRTIIVGSDVKNLDFADALTEFNDAGIRLVQLRSLKRNLTPLTEIVGEGVDAMVVSLDELIDVQPSTEEVRQYRLHSQYIDLPLVKRSGEDSDSEYRIIETDSAARALVGNEHLLSHLVRMDESKKHVVYVI